MSELIYAFLTDSNVEFTSSYLPDIRLGKIVKSMPILLTKEVRISLSLLMIFFHFTPHDKNEL